MKFSAQNFGVKLLLLATCGVVTVLGNAESARAFGLYFGEDLNFNGTENTRDRLTETPNASAAESAFLSQFDMVETETFDALALGTSGMTDLSFENVATATISGAGAVSKRTTHGVHPLSGENHWVTNAGRNDSFRVDFDQSVAAFGFYATDIGDVGASVMIELGLANGGTRQIDLNHNKTRGQSGSVLYQGIVAEDVDELFTSVRFVTENGRRDGFGFDNMTVGSWNQVQAEKTPEPAALLGLLAITGAMAIKRKREQTG